MNGAERGHALDLTSPARHVGTRLEGAVPAALTIEELAADYHHPNTGDVARAKREAGGTSAEDASRWLITEAIKGLQRRGKAGTVQLVEENDAWRFADGITFDDLWFQNRKLYREIDDHAQLRDPFNPMSGRFSENIRRNTGRDGMEELRESMRSFGWVEELPAIKDERGVVLVGHRRLAVAAELDLPQPWPIKVVPLGDGDEADAKRFALAMASNIGSKPFTPEERKEIAEYLYGEREWTMQRIGAALKVSHKTISKDLDGFVPKVQTSRPKGGRPKMTKKDDPIVVKTVEEAIDQGTYARDRLAEETGVGRSTIEMVAERIKGRKEVEARSPEREFEGAPEPQQQQPLRPVQHCPTCTCAS